MRKFTTIVAALLLSVATFAQAPQGFSYQAVVRDAQNAIVANQEVDVTLTITAEIDGVALQTYTEKHSVTTNANGLLTLVVGQGESSQKLSDIKWNLPNAIYNMRTETKYGAATTQLLSVPFAMYAEQAGDIDVNQLAKKLNSSDVQALLGLVRAEDLEEIRKYINDSLAAYGNTYIKKTDVNVLTNNYVTKEVFENYVVSGGNPEAVDLTVYAKNADVEKTYAKKDDVEKTYAKKDEIRNFTTMRDVKDTVGFYYAKKADLDQYAPFRYVADTFNYIRSSYAPKEYVSKNYVTKEAFDNYVLSGGQTESVDLTVYAKSADVEKTYAKKADIPSLSGYALKSDIPVMPSVPTKVSELQNDVNYLTSHQDISGKQDVIDDLDDIRSGAALGATALQSHQDISGKQDVIADLETIRSGAALGATSLQSHQDISGKQDVIADLETIRSGAALGATALQSHQDISGKQDVIADLETIRSGAALGATALQSHQSLAAYTKTADLADVATSGDYNDLTNKPTIPTVPTNVSAFTNDAAYVTLTQLQEQLAALQTEIERLQAFAPKFKKLKIQIVNPYAGNSSTWGYNTATVQFDGVSFTSGTKEFDVQVGSAMPLSVSLGTFKQTETNYYPYEYTYTVTVNGQPFDNVAGTYDRPTGYVYNTMRTIGLTELEEKGMIEGGDTKLSNNQIGYSWLNGLSGSNNQAEAKEQEKDTYYNRSAQQNEKYIYADIVDALADYDATTDHKPYEIGRNNPRGGNKYFENKLSIAVTNEDGRMSERYGEGNRVGMTPKGYYWSSGTWVGEDGVRALGLTHNSNYADNYLYYAPIYAKIPNFVYKMEYEQGEIYKVGTRKDELNGNMNGQNVGPFVDGENTIVITVKRVGGDEVHN